MHFSLSKARNGCHTNVKFKVIAIEVDVGSLPILNMSYDPLFARVLNKNLLFCLVTHLFCFLSFFTYVVISFTSNTA